MPEPTIPTDQLIQALNKTCEIKQVQAAKIIQQHQELLTKLQTLPAQLANTLTTPNNCKTGHCRPRRINLNQPTAQRLIKQTMQQQGLLPPNNSNEQ